MLTWNNLLVEKGIDLMMTVELDEVSRTFEESEFWKFLGLELDDIKVGCAKLKLPIRPSFINVKETVHGGIYASLLDTTMGMAARSLGYDEVATLQLNIQYVKSVNSGTIKSEARILNQSRSTALVEGKLYDEQNNLIAHCTGNFRMVKTDNS
ncbi:PaaI family thioesterase [Virgibacillus sp. C22-A2]|uniref:PaaI family thioesterase n=1 Tax=Virgibacillus tibetensis TaxID=3042313 RepID=A0ABU6KEE5_9BACI|nr:PaaI family thioesterase [Virgibacillus sp. C22-A2]